MLRLLPLEALDGGIEPGVYHNFVTDHVVLVHAVFVVGDDDIGLYLANDVAHGEAHLVVVRQQAVLIGQDIGLSPQVGGESLRLRNLPPAVFGDIRPGGRALLPCRQGQRNGPAAMDGAGGEQGSGGQLGVADVRADGKDRMLLHILTAPL